MLRVDNQVTSPKVYPSRIGVYAASNFLVKSNIVPFSFGLVAGSVCGIMGPG